MDVDSSIASSTSDPATNGGTGGWENTPVICKRHSFKGGSVCVRCGTPKPVHTPRVVSSTSEPRPARGEENIKMVRNAASLSWMALGMAVEYVPDRFERLKPLASVGRVMQFEAAIAGPRIQRGLKRTNLWKPLMLVMSRVGPWAELAPLLGPPILVGLMAMSERLEKRLGPVLLALMVPLMTETAEMAKEQSELLAMTEQFNAESVSQAADMIANFFGDDSDERTDTA